MRLSTLDVAILCGGLGKRLRTSIGQKQKTLAEISGKPFLEILLGVLKKQGFRRVVLCTGYRAKDVELYFKKKDLGLSIVFSREKTPLGTGGAIKNAKRLIESDLFFVLNGDCYNELSFSRFLSFHLRKEAKMSVAVTRVLDPKDFGSILLTKDKRVSLYEEKTTCARGNRGRKIFVNAGIYCFDKNIFQLMPRKSRFSIEYDFFAKLPCREFYGYAIKKDFIDIGTPARLKRAKALLKE